MGIRTHNQKRDHYEQYKGYGIEFIQGEWRAEAYANPQFTDTCMVRLKRKIRKYLAN